jgi:DNA-binding transcriptional ArsR family regulator
MDSADIIWKTCRVLANTTRLQILRRLFRGAELCVSDVAAIEGVSDTVASQHLRLLYDYGFLQPERKSKWVFYRFKEPCAGTPAGKICNSLRKKLCSGSTSHEALVTTFTALTHPRRVDIAQKLLQNPASFDDLVRSCSISPQSLYRHADKLIRRKFIFVENGCYRISPAKNSLHKSLLSFCDYYSHTS